MSIQDLKDLILGWIPDNVMRLISPQRARNAYYSIIEFFWDITGDKSELETSDKTNLVSAINEIKQSVDGATGFDITEIILTNGQSFLFPEMTKGEAFVIRIYDEPNGMVWLGGYDGVAVGNDTLVICLSNSVGGSFSDVGNQFVIINQGADSQVIFVDSLPDEHLARTGVIYVINSNNAMYVWDNQLGDYVLIGDVIPGTLISSTVFEDENNNVVVPEANKLYFDTTSEIYYRWNGSEYVLLNQSDDEIIFSLEVTKTELDDLIANEELIPNVLYKITGVHPFLYGGTTIYLQAISTTELNPNGIGKFYNPKYDQMQQGFGIAVDYVFWADESNQKPSGVYAVNDTVIWGGKHWTCIQPTTTTTKYIVDTFNLDTDYFEEIPFNETDYNVAYDVIKYDYENDWIVERNEKNSNIVSFTYEWLRYYECLTINCLSDPNDLIQTDPIKNFQWGNTFNLDQWLGIGSQRITNSVNQNINFRGSSQYELTFDNSSSQYNLTFDNGSHQFYLTFDNNSGQDNLTFDNSSSQYNLTFDNGSHQRNLTTSGSNRRQINLTFNSFQSNRTGQPLNSIETNLTFDNTVQNLPQYGQGNVTGTPTYILGVTADGKVIETDESDPTVPSHVKAITTADISNWDTAYAQRIQNLTTTGSSGAATLNSNTLNIPNYTLAGLGGVPLIRTITINGVEQDLSANRSWNLSEIVFYTTEPSNGEEGKLYISVLTGEMKIWTSGAWLGLTFSLHTEDTNDIEFTGDGTPANPLQASVGNKIPYKTIDTSVTEPDLAQLNAHGTDRVDFPNLNRIYFLNGAKWTYVETIDL